VWGHDFMMLSQRRKGPTTLRVTPTRDNLAFARTQVVCSASYTFFLFTDTRLFDSPLSPILSEEGLRERKEGAV
jgi:hypothetical protein